MAFSKGAVFFLLAFLSGTLVIEEGECQPVSAIAISEGSPVRTFILNNAGTVAFATGQKPQVGRPNRDRRFQSVSQNRLSP